MAVSQNGYRANDRSLIVSISVPGGKLAVRKGDVAVIMQYIAEQFHATVEPLKWPGNWGYAERKIRGGSSLSNHASGTAIDLNAPKHYLGAVGTFTSSQVRAIRKILSACEGTIRWGGDYRGRKDEMHFEINAGTAKVAKVAKKLRPKLQGPSIPGGGGGGGPIYKTVNKTAPLGLYDKDAKDHSRIADWQKDALGYTGKKVDGYFGPGTEKDTKALQRQLGVKDDGLVGDDTMSAWKKAGKPKLKKSAPQKPKPSGNAPKFPLPKGHWYGVESKNPRNHSGYRQKDRAGIRQLQQGLRDRNWKISVDGIYGPATRQIVTSFQRKAGIRVDGAVGAETWAAIFNKPLMKR